jgi:TRAP-type C4-dicarboxylate transport system substrate-binding protein
MSIVKSADEDISHYWELLNPLQKKTVLTVVKTFAKDQKDWWDELTESQQKAVDESIAEMKAGKLTSHADVMKKYKKWMKK